MKRYLILCIFIFGFIQIFTQDVKEFRHFTVENGFPSQNVNCFHQDDKGFIWMGTNSGLVRYNGYEFETFKMPPSYYKNENDQIIHCIYQDKQKIFWLGTSNGLVKYDPLLETFKKFPVNVKANTDTAIFNAMITDITADKNGDLWLASFDCFARFNKQTEKFRNYIYKDYRKFMFGPFFTNIELDKNKNIWLGSFNGIYFFDLKSDKLLKISDVITDSFDSTEITDLHLTNNHLLFSTRDNGIYSLNLSEKILIHLNNQNEEFPQRINDIFPYNEKLVLSADNACFIMYYDGSTWQIEKRIETGRSNTHFFIDSYENYWISLSYNGFLLYNQNEFEFSASTDHECGKSLIDQDNTDNLTKFQRKIFSLYSTSDTLLNPVYRDMGTIIDNEGFVWSITTEVYIVLKNGKEEQKIRRNTLYQYSPQQKVLKKFPLQPAFIFSHQLNLRKLISDQGKKWLATSKGLIMFNPKDTSFIKYDISKGLHDNNISDLTEDKNGNFWLATDNGLSKFNRSDQTFQNYTEKDGLHSTLLGRSKIFQTNDGKIIIKNKRGCTWFYPDEIKIDSLSNDLVLTGLKVGNQKVEPGKNSILNKSVTFENQFEIQYENKELTFEFIALNYYTYKMNKYAYLLEGYSDKWNEIGNRNNVSFVNLKPGKYKLKVNCSNNDGLWNEVPVEISFRVLPAWWQTWLFRGSLVLIILSLMVLIYRIRISSLKTRQRELENQVQERTKEIKEKNILLENQKEELTQQTDNLQEVNQLLNERQDELETLTDELKAQSNQLAEANDELQTLNATKDKFFNIIAHDLKNPFQGIIGFTSLLSKKVADIKDPEIKEFVKVIQDTSKGAFSLLENLLQWARSQTNRMKFSPEQINVASVITENINVLKLNAEKKKISLINHLPKNTFAFADKNMVTTIVRNLLNNAIKFTPEKGEITFSVEKSDERILLKIKDTGVGMSPNTVKKLFRIDTQYSTSGTSGESGTGLGLILCKEFAQKNGGDIRVESTEGVGSTFIVELSAKPDPNLIQQKKIADVALENEKKDKKHQNDEPLRKTEKSFEPVQEETTVKIDQNLRNKSILIVEDNANIRLNIWKIIEECFQPEESENGKLGYEKALKFFPDLIISDVMMPEMDGYELCEKVKTNPVTSHIPIIMLTAKSSDQSKIQGLETGADAYITKPFNPDVLLVTIKNLLKSREELKKLFSVDIEFKTEKLSTNSSDDQFLSNILKIIEENIENPDFSADDLQKRSGMNRTQFYKKIKSLTGHTVSMFIRIIRLKKAAQILKTKQYNISEVAYMVGFNFPNFFSKCFQEYFGKTPSQYVDN